MSENRRSSTPNTRNIFVLGCGPISRFFEKKKERKENEAEAFMSASKILIFTNRAFWWINTNLEFRFCPQIFDIFKDLIISPWIVRYKVRLVPAIVRFKVRKSLRTIFAKKSVIYSPALQTVSGKKQRKNPFKCTLLTRKRHKWPISTVQFERG